MTKPLSKKDIEAQIVDSFVEGRKMANNGNRMTESAKKFFAAGQKDQYKSATHIVTPTVEDRMGFDKEAFIADYGMDVYNKYYRPKPCTSYKVEER